MYKPSVVIALVLCVFVAPSSAVEDCELDFPCINPYFTGYTITDCSVPVGNCMPLGSNCTATCSSPGPCEEPPILIVCSFHEFSDSGFATWDGVLPTCTCPPRCPLANLTAMLPASVTVTCTSDGDPQPIGSTCTTNCSGLGMSGVSTFTCSDSGAWVGCPLTCSPVACPLLPCATRRDRFQYRDCQGPFYPGQDCDVRCGENHILCPGASDDLDCVGVAPWVSAWQGNQTCCRRPRRHRHRDDDDDDRDHGRDRDRGRGRDHDDDDTP